MPAMQPRHQANAALALKMANQAALASSRMDRQLVLNRAGHLKLKMKFAVVPLVIATSSLSARMIPTYGHLTWKTEACYGKKPAMVVSPPRQSLMPSINRCCAALKIILTL